MGTGYPRQERGGVDVKLGLPQDFERLQWRWHDTVDDYRYGNLPACDGVPMAGVLVHGNLNKDQRQRTNLVGLASECSCKAIPN